MTFDKQQLLSELQTLVTVHIDYVQSLTALPEKKLQYRLHEGSWSVLECLEHLNRYAAFYNQEIEKRLSKAKPATSSEFKSGYWGNKFAVDMLPKEGMKKIKTFQSKNPIHSNLVASEVLMSFLQHQETMMTLLEKAKAYDLNRIKTSITLPILKFKLGDTFRFVIHHNERHIVQVQAILANL